MDAETAMIESEAKTQVDLRFKKVPVVLTVILSLITAGIYIPCWFLARRKLLNGTHPAEKISMAAPVMILILYSFAVAAFVPAYLFGTILGIALYNYLHIVITYLGIALTLYLSFQIRAMLKDHFEGSKVSALWTFLFNIWYLQYKMNQHSKRQ